MNEQKQSADSQANAPALTVQDVDSATTMGQLWSVVRTRERHATDLVATDVVRDGYMEHGHPASLGFQHLSTMTSSRIRKQFPLADKSEPLFAVLYAEGKVIAAEEIVKKYEARRDGKNYDYAKSINARFAKLFKRLSEFKDKILELEYNDKH